MQKKQPITNKIVLNVSFLLSSLMLFSFFAPPVYAQTQPWKEGFCVHNGVATIQGVQCLVGNILTVAVSGIGLAAFVMIIVGAFKYLLSGGNSKGTEEGRKTITFAIGGIVLALSAYIILQLIANFTGVQSIVNFTLPSSSTGLSPSGGNMQINQ